MVSRGFIATVAMTLGVTILTACGGGDSASSAAKGGPKIVATTTQVGDLTRAVAGRRASVTQILQANSDPHEYEPRPSDVKAVAGATVVVRSGADVDRWLEDVLHNAGTGASVLTIIDAIRTRRLAGGIDPHWWQDPRNGAIAVGKIRDALVAADPRGRRTYSANAAAYLSKLHALDHAIGECIDRVPARERQLVTDHDALGYYADRYRIRVTGTIIPSLSTHAQASAGAVASLVRTIRSEHVRTIFSEHSVNPKLARAIARNAGAEVGPELYADTLGRAGSPGESYVGSLKANTQALVAGFTAGRTRCKL